MIARGTGYIRAAAPVARSRLLVHLKYVEHRSRDPEREPRESRRIFGKEADAVNRFAAVADVMNHTSRAVSFHKIVLSPGEDEPIRDWREWTREIMADLEIKLNKELHWYAVTHHNTDHDHVHVVLAGAAEHLQTGKTEVVKLMQPEYALLRESGRAHSEHEWYERLQDMVQELDNSEIASEGEDAFFEENPARGLEEGYER